MRADAAVKVLKERLEYLERKTLTRRLVGEPYGFLQREIAALDVACDVLSDDVLVSRVHALILMLKETREKLLDLSERKPSLQKMVTRIDEVIHAADPEGVIE